ncbi:MAG TPA: protein kinase, partial [Nevskiaceae bacterium]|nr:protein kinase [Nevskiaceae bacterium]
MTAVQIVLPDGTWIDNFRIVRRLGRGGFGVTYLAEEFREWEAGQPTGAPLRMVAMKEYFPRGLATRSEGLTVDLAPDVEGAETTFQQALKGFFQEAESLMRFDHPSVIKIHRVFRRNQTAYYVMPFLKGETLRAIIKRDGAMGEERVRRLVMPVIDGLIHAHAKGILHRDIKPENVMVPDEGAPVLIDFGAARAQAQDADEQYTRYSELVAYTPGYAALEQYHRATRENPHGAHTDVYGIAAVMYHCVTGEPPVESSKRALEISNGRPDPLQPASAKLMDTPGYGRAFLAAIDWGLELAGKDRPQTLAEFRRALEGRHDIPQSTLTRLERYGVSTEPFTRVVTSIAPAQQQDALAAERRRLEQDRKAFEEQKANTLREIERQTAARFSAPGAPSPELEAATELLARPGRAGDTAPVSTVGLATAPLTTTPAPPRTAPPPAPPPPPTLPRAPEPLHAPERSVAPASGGGRKGLVFVGIVLIALGAAGYMLTNEGPWSPFLGVPKTGPAPAPGASAPADETKPVPPPVDATTAAKPPETPPAEPRPVEPPPPEPAKPEVPAGPSLAEREAFDAAKGSGTLEGWRAFKKKFPKSELADAADVQIATLEARARAEAPPPAPAPAPTITIPQEPEAATAPATTPRAPATTASAAQGGRPRNASAADCAVCPELVSVPGGRYEMGDAAGDGEADERPVHTVSIAPMRVGRY